MKKTRQLLDDLFESVDPDLLRQAIRHHMRQGRDLETAKEMAWQQSGDFPKPRPPRPRGHIERIRAVASEPVEPPKALNTLMALPAQDQYRQ